MDEPINLKQLEHDEKMLIAEKYFRGNTRLMKLFVECMKHEHLTDGKDQRVRAECAKMDLIGTATMKSMQDIGGNNARAFLYLFSAMIAYLHELESFKPINQSDPKLN